MVNAQAAMAERKREIKCVWCGGEMTQADLMRGRVTCGICRRNRRGGSSLDVLRGLCTQCKRVIREGMAVANSTLCVRCKQRNFSLNHGVSIAQARELMLVEVCDVCRGNEAALTVCKGGGEKVGMVCRRCRYYLRLGNKGEWGKVPEYMLIELIRSGYLEEKEEKEETG